MKTGMKRMMGIQTSNPFLIRDNGRISPEDAKRARLRPVHAEWCARCGSMTIQIESLYTIQIGGLPGIEVVMLSVRDCTCQGCWASWTEIIPPEAA